MTKCDVLGICGSLRAKSCNAYALAAAAELMPPGMTLRIASIAELPLYNQDVQDAGMPQSVTRLRDAIAQADALLIASPEYNFSVTGALKNAVDWLSRTGPQPFKDKPVAILSATAGPLGGARCQYDLRRILGCLEAQVLLRPEVFIGLCQSKFDDAGCLIDAPTRKFIGDQMVAFERWIIRLGARSLTGD